MVEDNNGTVPNLFPKVNPQAYADIKDKTAKDRDADRMWKFFQQIESVPVTIKASVFSKYQVLFSSEKMKDYEEYTAAEVGQIERLSGEFMSMINIYKPFHIVDDYTGEVLMTFPAIMQPVQDMRTKEGRAAIDVMRAMADTAYDQPWKIQQSVYDVAIELVKSNDRGETIARGKEFYAQAEALHNSVLNTRYVGPGQFVRKSPEQVQQITPATKPAETQSADDEDLGFEF